MASPRPRPPRRRPSRPSRRRRITTDAAVAPEPDGSTAEAEETGPLRRCIVTRERLPKERMIRFVIAPDRRLVPDLTATLPGRGIWLSARRDVIEGARAQGLLVKAFARAARGPVIVPPDLVSELEGVLARRIGERLGLARRAGQAVPGFEKAREWLRGGRARLIVQAADGSEDERSRFLGGAAHHIPVVAPLPAAALGRIFGRERVVHVAVAQGGLAQSIATESARLAGLAAPGGSGQTLHEQSRPKRRGDDGLNERTGA